MKILSLVLCAIYSFTVGIVTSFFDMGCLLITFICISLDKEN